MRVCGLCNVRWDEARRARCEVRGARDEAVKCVLVRCAVCGVTGAPRIYLREGKEERRKEKRRRDDFIANSGYRVDHRCTTIRKSCHGILGAPIVEEMR